ncbi:MAG: SdiA-regulated domain-containing protein [Flavisolibacter sp.]|nr:SdiA-regulated domain-containing protein [Flavisolibacter sp.]
MKIALVTVSFCLPLFIFCSNYRQSDHSGEEKESNYAKRGKNPASHVRVLQKWTLPSVLIEISGITYLDASRFACIQDELGVLFIYNTATGEVEKKVHFAGNGDYEGIAIAGTAAYIIRSDGKLFEVADYMSAKPAVTSFQTHLNARNDVEGLCYDERNNRLLVAIKGKDANSNDYKGIYAFDLTSKKMPQEPVYKINLDDPVFEGAKGKNKATVIQPSEIQVHPLTNEIYILEGTNPKLLILDENGKAKKLYAMQKKDFPQAEGLTFSPNGELYISNEGRIGGATIVKAELSSN